MVYFMISWLLWFVLGSLIIASIIDIKYKAIPSVALTGLLFIVAVMRIDNLYYGVLAVLFAWVIKDIIYDFNGLDFGMADIKIMAIIGLLTPTMNMFLIFIGIFSIFQFVYTLIWTWQVGADKERPFIPCLLAVYVELLLLGVVL
jgi:hypothetical protein